MREDDFTTDTVPKVPPRVRCPLCGQLVWLLLDGRLRQHRAAPSRRALMCKASGRSLDEAHRLTKHEATGEASR